MTFSTRNAISFNLFLILLSAPISPAKADHVEEEFTGVFCQTIQNDYKNKVSTTVYGLFRNASELARGRKPHKKLIFKDEIPELVKNGIPCGTEVKFSGRDTHSRRVRVHSETFVFAGGNGGGGGGGDASAPAGEQRLLVFRVNFLDSNVPCTASSLNTSVFTASNSLNADYVQASYGALSFSGEVFETSIDYAVASTTCDYYAWAAAAEAAATSAGYTISQYPRRLFFLPSNAPCGWGGVANLGGNPSRAWVRGCSTGIAIHEEGHNMTMHHASSFINGTLSEYGDSSDPMGGAAVVGFNAPHKSQMGWVRAQQINSTTTSTISALNLDPVSAQNPQILKFSKPDTADDYYISFRNATGFDGALSSSHLNRLAIHRYKGGMVQSILLGTLGDGQSFIDSVNNYTIRLLSHTADTATVEVSLVGGGPVAPSTSLSPSSQSAAAGAVLSYTIQVTNKDTGANPSTFNLAFSGSNGLSGSLASSTLTLAPGQSGSTSLDVASAAGLAAGSYVFSIGISDSATAVHNAALSGTYVVAAQDTTPPTINLMNPKANTTLTNKTTIKAEAIDQSGPVSKIQLILDSTVVKTCNNKTLCQVNVNTNGLAAGAHTVTATATDKFGNTGSASVAVLK